MDTVLAHDLEQLPNILAHTLKVASSVLNTLQERPVAVAPAQTTHKLLPISGLGFAATLEQFLERYAKGFSGSAGSRYLGFVTGGSTPAALAGDWLTSVFDQNPTSNLDSSAPDLERECISMLKTLFALPSQMDGVFVSGATMSNFVGLAMGREWVGQQLGYSVSQSGLRQPIRVFSGTAHSSTYKALAMLGMGRESLHSLPLVPGRECIDLVALEMALKQQQTPCIVVANVGTVNTVDFDDLHAILKLRQKYPFWLHADAAFGGFAALSERYCHFSAGMGEVDSLCIDAHKWLNVPYDSAMSFSHHANLRLEVFQNSAVYLGMPSENPDFVHLTPENSRRLRALPAWFTLNAYGQTGYRQLVERCCDLAQALGERIATEPRLELLADVRMNVVCFALKNGTNQAFLERLRQGGETFMTPTALHGKHGVRAAFSNWRTTPDDLERIWDAVLLALEAL